MEAALFPPTHMTLDKMYWSVNSILGPADRFIQLFF